MITSLTFLILHKTLEQAVIFRKSYSFILHYSFACFEACSKA